MDGLPGGYKWETREDSFNKKNLISIIVVYSS